MVTNLDASGSGATAAMLSLASFITRGSPCNAARRFVRREKTNNGKKVMNVCFCYGDTYKRQASGMDEAAAEEIDHLRAHREARRDLEVQCCESKNKNKAE